VGHGRVVIVNPLTGETVLRDGHGTETRILFTEEAIMAAEQATGCGILELLDKAASARLQLRELQILVWSGMNGYAHRSGSSKTVPPERALKVIRNCGGMLTVLPKVAEALTRCSALGLPVDVDDETAATGDDEVDPTTGD
jgi:hypothetical protein